MVQILAGIHIDSGHAGLHILSNEIFEHGNDRIRLLSGAFPLSPRAAPLCFVAADAAATVPRSLLTPCVGCASVFCLVCCVIYRRWHGPLR